MTGAPQLSGSNGSFIQVLDACLINGFNLQSIDSLVYDGNAGKCIATINAGHGFEEYQVVLIEGAGENEYNGEARVTVVDANTFTYVPDNAPSIFTATGTITAKAAPLGWAKPFSGTNKAIYKSVDPLAAAGFLRIDDNYVNRQKVHGCRAVTDIDTYNDPYPAGMFGWWRENNESWALVGDSRTFYLVCGVVSFPWSYVLGFGDFQSFQPGDGDYKFIGGGNVYYSNTGPAYSIFSPVSNVLALQADHLGVPDAAAGVYGNRVANTWGRGGPALDPATGTIVLNGDALVVESNHAAFRGKLRGVYQPLHQANINFFDIVMAEKLFAVMSDIYTSRLGTMFVDLEGPWG